MSSVKIHWNWAGAFVESFMWTWHCCSACHPPWSLVLQITFLRLWKWFCRCPVSNHLCGLVGMSFQLLTVEVESADYCQCIMWWIADHWEWSWLCDGGWRCLLLCGQLPWIWLPLRSEAGWKPSRWTCGCWYPQAEPCRLCSLEGQHSCMVR